MPDMLVNLLRLPPMEPLLDVVRKKGMNVRRAQPFEQSVMRQFGAEKFAAAWADEISVAYANKPVSLFVATRAGEGGSRLSGFAGYECTRRNYFGPMGVVE